MNTETLEVTDVDIDKKLQCSTVPQNCCPRPVEFLVRFTCCPKSGTLCDHHLSTWVADFESKIKAYGVVTHCGKRFTSVEQLARIVKI